MPNIHTQTGSDLDDDLQHRLNSAQFFLNPNESSIYSNDLDASSSLKGDELEHSFNNYSNQAGLTTKSSYLNHEMLNAKLNHILQGEKQREELQYAQKVSSTPAQHTLASPSHSIANKQAPQSVLEKNVTINEEISSTPSVKATTTPSVSLEPGFSQQDILILTRTINGTNYLNDDPSTSAYLTKRVHDRIYEILPRGKLTKKRCDGFVVYFNRKKDYGLVKCVETGNLIYVDKADLVQSPYHNGVPYLTDGEIVQFDLYVEARAMNVTGKDGHLLEGYKYMKRKSLTSLNSSAYNHQSFEKNGSTLSSGYSSAYHTASNSLNASFSSPSSPPHKTHKNRLNNSTVGSNRSNSQKPRSAAKKSRSSSPTKKSSANPNNYTHNNNNNNNNVKSCNKNNAQKIASSSKK